MEDCSEETSPEIDLALVMYFDVLGFSERLKEIGLTAVAAQYDRLLTMIPSGPQLVRGGFQGVPSTFVMTWESCWFSDSFIVWTHYLVPDMIDPALDLARRIFCDCMANGLPVRGGIAAGPAVLDNSRRVYIGEPIIDAVRAEAAQHCAGIAVAASWNSAFDGYLGTGYGLLPYEGHLKPGHEDVAANLVLDWPRTWRESPEHSANDLDSLFDEYSRPGFERYWQQTRALVAESVRFDGGWDPE